MKVNGRDGHRSGSATFGYQGGLDLEFEELPPSKKVRGTNKFSTKNCSQIIVDELKDCDVNTSIDYLKEVSMSFNNSTAITCDLTIFFLVILRRMSLAKITFISAKRIKVAPNIGFIYVMIILNADNVLMDMDTFMF
mgnify:CR=1 FL=1